MKNKIAFLLLACSLCLHATSITLPGDRDVTEGNASIFPTGFFGANSTQMQIAAPELMALGLTPGMSITGMRLRLNGGLASSPAFTFPDFEVLLGEAVNAIGGMSTTFADNFTNGVLVYDGAYTELAGAYSGGATPNAFGPVIAFSAPFQYNGGDLIVQIRRTVASFAGSLVFDGSSTHAGAGTAYQSVTASSFSATGGSFTATMPVLQLEAQVPEPGAVVLMISGMALLPIARRLRA